ncbi:uncharacterized protein BT62DRAFT_933447 [Guyanagaster necrorhizus]|uniref:GPI inositol-deacylase n=1 Tax=Guyanagaster necrorhizus TaxID=856835 RepID=A0A9P7VR24_9AGAR|nr:uncharacterized protein BT62DRAFT_933447 [Guyanagaster necrorhizus MCA 3950]KAG7445032.1 hypothetical protein BT62DRAFT_933447 [Guyanagaster necrorhizus MCA 3950]
MASDVLHFISKHHLTNVSLLGHSMGGKVAAAVALAPNLGMSTLSHLISEVSNEFKSYVKSMKKIEAMKVKTRKEAVDILHETEKSPHTSHGHAHFRIPISILGSSIQDIGSFPYEGGERQRDGKALFIRGEKSPANIPLVHAERPMELKKLVTDFVS